MHIYIGSREFPDQASGGIGHNDHMASEGYVLLVIKVSVGSLIVNEIHFRKKLIFGRYMFPERICFQVDFVLEGLCFRKEMSSEELVSRWNMLLKESHFQRNMLPEETCFWKEYVSGRLVLGRTPPRGSYLYT